MRIFITGASGFVGGAVAQALAREHDVLAMSRSASSDVGLRGIGATPVRADLAGVLPTDLATSEVVVHCAAHVSQWGTREDFWRANVDGTQRMLETARAAGVRRFIHIGTEAALFHGQHMRDIDESYPYPGRTPFLYSETKAAAERLVLGQNAAGFATLSIRPRFVWGPGDRTILPVLIGMVRSGRFSWIDGGRSLTATTHIANLVHAVRLALTAGQGGQAYFVTDEGATSFREFLTALLATQDVTAPSRSLPGWLARSMAFAVETSWRALSLANEPPLTRFAASLMSHDCTLRIDKAKRDLGYEPQISRAEGLRALRV